MIDHCQTCGDPKQACDQRLAAYWGSDGFGGAPTANPEEIALLEVVAIKAAAWRASTIDNRLAAANALYAALDELQGYRDARG